MAAQIQTQLAPCSLPSLHTGRGSMSGEMSPAPSTVSGLRDRACSSRGMEPTRCPALQSQILGGIPVIGAYLVSGTSATALCWNSQAVSITSSWALSRHWRQESQEFKASLPYIES